ncbi:MAG TPA: outer membrane lipid asymmetry maintenance protein MlaD [Acetobacteraceae bacterium]|jgi:phospholipid/cholesterol/gamma-HCH transport system substrate-binding protein|nr:outer membrane lipid asymmetry maintenance protein MlaD [Acetobacteraceae bacterium]
MARRNNAELSAGLVVIVVAIVFLGYAVASTGHGPSSGYTLTARFNSISGLSTGSDVRLAGVPVGRVTSERIDPSTYQAVITFSVRDDLKLPTDSSAQITSDGLLGGVYLSLSPGGDEKMLPSGGTVQITQGAVSLEELLGKFIFSVSDLSENVRKQLQADQQRDKEAPK